MPASAPNMAGQSARITMLHMLQASADPQGNVNINLPQIAITHGNVVTAWAEEMHRQAADKEKYLEYLQKLKSGDLKLHQIIVTDDGVQIKAERGSEDDVPRPVAAPGSPKEKALAVEAMDKAEEELKNEPVHVH